MEIRRYISPQLLGPNLAYKMPLWSLKYSLAFLLGAVTIVLFIFLQIRREGIGVVIHRKRFPASYPSYADHPDAIGIKSTDPSDTAASVNTVDGSDVLSKKDTPHHDSVDWKHLQKTDTGLLSRHVRQVSPVLEGQLPLSNITMASKTHAPKKRTKKDNNKSRKLSKTENVPVSVLSLEEALSKTAPDWVGSTIPPIDIADVKCNDKICTEHLSEVDRDQFTMCMQRTIAKKDKIGSILPNANETCHFQNGTYRHPVALASFPGSGNTWMRGLLQKTTGICTGV